MQLTKNFNLAEFTKSDYAIRNGVSNEPTEEHLQNIKTLCEKVLQPLRDVVGPLRITSGYRSNALNTLIGGSRTSEHCFGMAADLEFWEEGKEDNKKLFNAILALELPFTQLIWEFGDNEQPNWVHVSYNPNRIKKEVLKAERINGKTTYSLI